MNGKSISDFISDLYYNPEIEFVYQDMRYMVSGYMENNEYTLELFNISQDNCLFKMTDVSRIKCIEAFEEALIFNGKTIYDVEKDITVLYG
ncbi:MAG: hypothetical protein LKG21_02560 [Ruminococcus sp.]|nr:hypothetical protein [Ruminococcus sp.]